VCDGRGHCPHTAPPARICVISNTEHPHGRFYIRRVRLASTSELLPPLQAAGYRVEEAVGDPRTAVVEIPVDAGEGIRTLKEVGASGLAGLGWVGGVGGGGG
jgi:hypothetical protein